MPKEIKEKATEIFQCEFTEETTRILLDTTEDNSHELLSQFMEAITLNDPWIARTKINHFAEETRKWRDVRRKPFDTIFCCSPKNPDEDNDSKKILKDALKGNLSRGIIGFNPKTFEEDIVQSIGPTRFTYFVDTEKRPLEQVVAEITYWYKMHTIPNTPGEHKQVYETRFR